MIEEEEEKLILNNNKENKTKSNLKQKKKTKNNDKKVNFAKDVNGEHKEVKKTKKETSKAMDRSELIKELISELKKYQQYLQTIIETHRRELTDKNIVKLFTNPDTIIDLLKKIKKRKKEIPKKKTQDTKEEYDQLSALEDKLRIINKLYTDENEVFNKINEINDQLDEISNQNLISINEIKEQIDNPQQKENRQKEEKLNKQKQQFTQQIINRFNNILGKLPSIKKIQTKYRKHLAIKKINQLRNFAKTIQPKFRQHLANKKINQVKNVAKTIQEQFHQYLKIEKQKEEAVKKYILDNLTLQNNQNNADIQNIDNQIQVRISKQEIESKKQKIGFLESIFCCCSRSTIAKQEHNQLIDRFLQSVNADNNNNITVNLDTINTINNIKQAMRNN